MMKYLIVRVLPVHMVIWFLLLSCSIHHKMERGKVVPSSFYEKIEFTTAKGLMLVPAEFEGKIKNYLFDTGSELTGIQRTELKGKRVTVRGATNRSVESGTEVLKSFKIKGTDFRNTFATNGDMKGLKEQIPNFGGVLGRTIIDRANWLIDIPNKTCIISDRELSDETFTDIPLDKSIEAPYTLIEIDGKQYPAILDLGSTAMLNVPNDSDLAKELMQVYQFEDRARERYTVGGLQSIIQQVGILPSLKIGDKKFKNIEVAINESSQLRVGMNLFKNKIIYIDNVNRKYRVK